MKYEEYEALFQIYLKYHSVEKSEEAPIQRKGNRIM